MLNVGRTWGLLLMYILEGIHVCLDVSMFTVCAVTKFGVSKSVRMPLIKQHEFTQWDCGHWYCTHCAVSASGRGGLGLGGTHWMSVQITRRKNQPQTRSDLKDRKWVVKVSYKSQSAIDQGLSWHTFTFLQSKGGISLCLRLGDWQSLCSCSAHLGEDELAGKLEVLGETIIQFLSSVQLMAFI